MLGSDATKSRIVEIIRAPPFEYLDCSCSGSAIYLRERFDRQLLP
jgi:hypothetical protein